MEDTKIEVRDPIPGIGPFWLQGDSSLILKTCVAVVGTRRPTPEGKALTREICKALKSLDMVVVSGLAEGIDTVAHQTALEVGGETISVLPTSIEKCYPPPNFALKKEISKKGLLVSQFPPDTRIQKHHFIARNRTMVEIADFAIVVEASENSGTRHLVDHCKRRSTFVGFPSSLLAKKYPWIEIILAKGLGFEITNPNTNFIKFFGHRKMFKNE